VEIIAVNNLAKVRWTLCIVAVLTLVALVQGGVLWFPGGAASGATYGTVKHVNNTLQTTQNVGLDKAWTAANAALTKLKMPVAESARDGASGKLEARSARNQALTIELTRRTDSVTDIQITVGRFDSPENRAEAQQIYDQLAARL
jgi:hypothetical protein